MPLTRLVIDHETTGLQQIDQMGLRQNESRLSGQNLVNYFAGLVSGVRSAALLTFAVDAVQASSVLTFTGLPTAAQTMVLGNSTITARASGASGLEFNIGATATITATNFVNLVNTNATLSPRFTASSAAGVVTILVSVPGQIGNAVQVSEDFTNATVTAFSGGTLGTPFTVDLR